MCFIFIMDIYILVLRYLGDYAPHTAMMRSFSLGNNYPTQYPHFGGADVKYHFMFQFLSGNLEYLGMNLDIAYNSVSILSLWCFFMILVGSCKKAEWKLCCQYPVCFISGISKRNGIFQIYL